MADQTKIEWTDATWNPIRGCTRVSPGCGGPGPHGGCYAEGIAARFSGPGQAYEGLAERRGGKARWTGKISFGHDLDAPLRWRRPRRIFVNSMSDLFHEGLAVDEIATVYAVCVAAYHLNGHVSQILTKRSTRMREVLASEAFWDQVNAEAGMHVMERTDPLARRSDDARATLGTYDPDAPPPGVWLGVSCEDQTRADERVPDLLATPAAVRFVSAEPLLGPIDFTRIDLDGHYEQNALSPYTDRENWDRDWSPEVTGAPLDECIHDFEEEFGRSSYPPSDARPPRLDWIIVGGESGPNARPMHPQWARSLREQCAGAGTPFFFKQWGAWANPGCVRQHGDTVLDGMIFRRVGKKAAGRLLDGRTHNGMPEARHVG